MKTKIISIGFLTAVAFTSFGQEQTAEVKKINIHDFSIQGASVTEHHMNGTISDFKSLAPNSLLRNHNFAGFKADNGIETESYNLFSVLLGLQFSDKNKTTYRNNPILRLGFTYYSGTFLKNSLSKEDRFPYDTLTSSQTGQTIYVDSLYKQNYDMNYNSDQIRLDGSLIFSTNPSSRWSFYAGAGATFGISINANTEITYSSSRHEESSYSNDVYYHTYNHHDNNDINESFRNKTNLAFSGYVPLGVDFRIGRRNELLKHTHLFFEMRPGINVISIPEVDIISNAAMQGGFGLKYILD